MALEKRVKDDELKLYEVLRNPVFFWQLLSDYVEEDKPVEERSYPYDYQQAILLDFGHKVAIQASRSGGKTYTLVRKILWTLVWNTYPNADYIVYTVPNKVHLDPVWNGLVNLFKRHPFLKQYVDLNRGINGSDHRIITKNRATLLCRIAGTAGNGVNVNGLHTPLVILDEAGFYPWGTWMELQPTINTWEPGHQLVVSGVPTGLREKNVLFFATEGSDQFSVHKFNAFDNPRYTEEQHQEDLKTYGGKDSDDYIHFVLGEHGSPSYSLFDRDLMQIESYPVYKLSFSGIDIGENINDYIQRLDLLPEVPNETVDTYFGIDLGFTEPTALYIFWEDNNGQLRFHVKIRMTKVPYPIQQKIFYYLDKRYSPRFIAIDEGSSGKSVIQEMIMSPEYADRHYDKRIIPVSFGGFTVVGYADNKEIKQRTKVVAVEYLQRMIQSHRLVFSSTDMDTITELERMTYIKKPNGDIVFRTLTSTGGVRIGGEDHFASALLCLAFGYYQNENYHRLRRRKRISHRARLTVL